MISKILAQLLQVLAIATNQAQEGGVELSFQKKIFLK